MEADKIFPANWKEIIQGKKVILYNTGVTSILRGQEKRIEKMKWVFDIFKEHSEVVLWWRPHPLELSTVQSMIPDLKEQYTEVRRRFKEENIGILDESADLNRAIAVSDAYYGAWSSIVELYKATKKPVLCENNRVRKTEAPLFWPNAICVKDNFIWFIQANSNKLVKVNRSTYDAEDIISIPMENPYKLRLYNDYIIDMGDSLLLLLEKSENIYEYEIITGRIKIHRLNINNFKIYNKIIIKKQGKLCMFPYIGNHILEYDYRLDSVTIMGDMESQDIKAAKCYEIVETKIYMVGSGSNNVYRYDFTNHSYIKKNVGDKSNKFWGIKKAGQYFVLPRLDKKVIILWNEENGKVIELTKFPEHYAYSEGRAYLDMFEWKGDMYIFPFYANMILKIDVENKLITQAFSDILCMPNYDTNTEGFSSETYLCVGRYQNYIYAYATYKKCLQIFDLDAISIQDISLSEIKKEEHKKLVENILNNEIYAESFCEVENASICNLENYIVNVQIIDRESGVNNISKTCIGQNIYKQIIDI